MRTFGAESPRAEVDQVALNLYRDEQGFVCLEVNVDGSLRRLVRIGQPTARSLGQAIIDMAHDDDAEEPF